MKSELLSQSGLMHHIGGMDYNFRHLTQGDKMAEDLSRIQAALPTAPRVTYTGQQVHGDNVAYADGQNGEDFLNVKIFQDTDGLVTNQPGVALLVKFADCTPVVLYDPVNRVQGIVHSGWRSTVKRISQVALKRMIELGAELDNIVAYVGPSIAMEHYQVGPEVYQAFGDFKTRDEFFVPDVDDRYLMSMVDGNIAILREAGLRDDQIEVNRESTWGSERLHSSREEGSDYGLNAMITLIPEA